MKELNLMYITGFGLYGTECVRRLQELGYKWNVLNSKDNYLAIVLADFSGKDIGDDLKAFLLFTKSFSHVDPILIDVTPDGNISHPVEGFYSYLYIKSVRPFDVVRNFIKLYDEGIVHHGIVSLDLADLLDTIKGRKLLTIEIYPFREMLSGEIAKEIPLIPNKGEGVIYLQTSQKEEKQFKKELVTLKGLLEKDDGQFVVHWGFNFSREHYLCVMITTDI